MNERLRLVREIGAGGMGAVWLAEDASLDREVAVKLIGGKQSPAAVKRFQREAALCARIKSPHVVEIYGHGVTDDGTPYIEMELLQGEPLSVAMIEGRLTLDVVLDIVD